jgi:hypothetical protein
LRLCTAWRPLAANAWQEKLLPPGTQPTLGRWPRNICSDFVPGRPAGHGQPKLVSWFRSSLAHDAGSAGVVDAESLDGGEDVIGGLGPAEGLGIGVVLVDEGLDAGLQLGDAAMDAYLAFGEQGEEPLDLPYGEPQGLMHPHEIVVRREERERVDVVFDLLRESVGQPSEASRGTVSAPAESRDGSVFDALRRLAASIQSTPDTPEGTGRT